MGARLGDIQKVVGSNPTLPTKGEKMKDWKKRKKYSNEWELVLNRQHALEIKKLRKTGTYRRVARIFAENHPELKICNGNQIEGQLLCDAAAKKLKLKTLDK